MKTSARNGKVVMKNFATVTGVLMSFLSDLEEGKSTLTSAKKALQKLDKKTKKSKAKAQLKSRLQQNKTKEETEDPDEGRIIDTEGYETP